MFCMNILQPTNQFVKLKNSLANNDNIIQQRRSANYKPNIWKYSFIQSLTTKYDGVGCKRLAEKLKEDVRPLFVEPVGQLEKLELIDCMKKLGLAYLFEEEIDNTLYTIAAAYKKSSVCEQPLYPLALGFRLLRQNGNEVSQDIFNGFINENESGIESKSMEDLKGLLELYEASHLGVEGESIVEEVRILSTEILKNKLKSNDLEDEIRKEVDHALAMCLHHKVEWFNVKRYINLYEKDNNNNINTKLIELAKLNYNMVQANLQKDLQEISRWWRNISLTEELDFTRDRLVESFYFSVGIAFESEHSDLRKWFTKTIILILVIDDVYDVYGSFDELYQFTQAVDRWDTKKVEGLPKCMKISFQALYDNLNEIANEIQQVKGWDHHFVLHHLKKSWADFCKSMLVEAMWYKEGYMPSFDEYLNNACISSSGSVLSMLSFFSTTDNDFSREETITQVLDQNHDVTYALSLIIRLANDLATNSAERERGDAPSSIVCYQKETNGYSNGKVEEHIKKMINESWKILTNKKIHLRKSSNYLSKFLIAIVNTARMTKCLYQYEDGFGVQDRQTKTQIMSVLVEPLEFPLSYE